MKLYGPDDRRNPGVHRQGSRQFFKWSKINQDSEKDSENLREK